MSVHETQQHHRVRWTVPVTAAVIGIGYLVAGIAGDRIGFGIFGLALMLVVGGAFVVAGHFSETFAGLADRCDERINQLDLRASTFAGFRA